MSNNRFCILTTLALLSTTAVSIPVHAQTQPVASAPASPLDAAMRKAVIDGAIAQINSNYVFPDKVLVVAKALRRKASSGSYDAIRDPEAFTTAVNADIAAVAHDKHLHLFWSAEALPPAGDGGEPSPAEIEQMTAMIARMNFNIPKAEVLAGNIGYMKIDGFIRASIAGPTFVAAMAFLQHSDAMIFDLRDNHGGDPAMVALAMSYLVPPDTEINDFHQRNTTVDVQTRTLPYVPGGLWSTDKPIYVLTSKKTGSAGEEFAYDIQQLKRGTIVGEPTWGGANPGTNFPIDKHFGIFVPTGAAVNPISKTNWDGTGVKPDVAVDPATGLEAARRMALDKLIEHATGDQREELQQLLQPTTGSPAK